MIYIAIFGGLGTGLMLFLLARLDPVAYFYYFDVVAAIIWVTLIIASLIRLRKAGAWAYFDNPKHNKALLEFLYRDGVKRPVYGSRIVGTGFFQVPALGIVQDVGRKPTPGSVYFHGDKPVRYVLQDINHTPNPKFANFYGWVTSLGVNRIEELQDVLAGYNPELMVKVWNKLVDYDYKEPTDKMIEDIQDMGEEDRVKFNEELDANKVGEKVDSIFRKGGASD